MPVTDVWLAYCPAWLSDSEMPVTDVWLAHCPAWLSDWA